MSDITNNNLARIADYADSHDFAAEMSKGRWIEGDAANSDPMVSTSLRLPKSLLDWVRDQADEQHMRPTALIRSWIEQERAGAVGLTRRVVHLEETVFRRSA
ncbi:MAG: hypothetical protein ACRDPW_09750 [Mycobacteriales bacterium]